MTTCTAEFHTDQPIVSPDGWSKVTVGFGERKVATEWHIALLKQGRIIHRLFLPEQRDVRDVKVSWSPSSRAVLLGENYKDGMDLTLWRISGRRVVSTQFALAGRMSTKTFKELPLHAERQSEAPVERVTWGTVKWLTPKRCAMLYIISGLGYQGEGNVTVDFTGRRPVLKTSHLRPLAHPEYFNTD